MQVGHMTRESPPESPRSIYRCRTAQQRTCLPLYTGTVRPGGSDCDRSRHQRMTKSNRRLSCSHFLAVLRPMSPSQSLPATAQALRQRGSNRSRPRVLPAYVQILLLFSLGENQRDPVPTFSSLIILRPYIDIPSGIRKDLSQSCVAGSARRNCREAISFMKA